MRLEDLAGVGPETAAALRELGVTTPRDLLAYLPRDYKDWRVPTPIATVVARALVEPVEEIAVGELTAVRAFNARMPIVNATLVDASGALPISWFGRRGLAGRLREGMRVFVHGRAALKASRTRGSRVELTVLSHRVLAPDEEFTGEIVPIYPASKDLSTKTIRTIVQKNLRRLIALAQDRLPERLAFARGFAPAAQAWHDVHEPPSPEAAANARERLIFEEFFGIALAAAMKRAARAEAGGAYVARTDAALLQRFEDSLPFALTPGQRVVIDEIWRDMGSEAPMNRLLQGDVGSGKTLVAAAAIVAAANSGLQSALMAPTEILAAQHARKLAPLLMPFGITVEAVFGSLGAVARRNAENRIASGEASLAVGTHALLTESVEFARLGLAIVDEQHRFGVAQRAQLRAKSGAPHTLYMTATPIPRTLAQVKYADLDLSIIEGLPPGRTPIETFVVRESRMSHVEAFVRENLRVGRQAYVVAPAIEEGETDLTSAVAEADRLRSVFGEFSVGLLHGKLAPREKDAVMSAFAKGDIDLLIATTVVEVGVDVPNASVMVILDAHRFGLAQLHQLRGRVGRGVERSFCILVAPDDAADSPRLEILTESNDGFRIAEADLALRQAGELAGTAQAGSGGGTLGSIVQDLRIYVDAKREADAIVSEDPHLQRAEHVALRALVEEIPAARAVLISS